MKGRLERELEEVLARAGDLPSPPRQRRRWRRPRLPSLRVSPSVTPGRLALAGLALLLAGLLLRPVLRPVAGWAVVPGLALLVASYVLSVRRAGRPPERRWRGRPVDDRPPDEGPSGRRRR